MPPLITRPDAGNVNEPTTTKLVALIVHVAGNVPPL